MKKGILLLIFILVSGCASQSPQENTEIKPEESIRQEKKIEIGTVGTTIEKNSVKLTLENVNNYVDNSEWAMDVPAEGKEFILLNFIAENTGKEDEHINMFYASAYCDNVAVDSEAILINTGKDTVWGDVVSGKMRKGYVAYELDTNWQKLEFTYDTDPLKKGDEITFEIYKADVLY